MLCRVGLYFNHAILLSSSCINRVVGVEIVSDIVLVRIQPKTSSAGVQCKPSLTVFAMKSRIIGKSSVQLVVSDLVGREAFRDM